MAHVKGADCAAEYTDDVKESRKGQDPLRFGQSPREDRLQHNAADQTDKRKSLSNADEQFCPVEVFRRPGSGVLRAHPRSECRTTKARGEEQAWIDFAQKQERGNEGNR